MQHLRALINIRIPAKLSFHFEGKVVSGWKVTNNFEWSLIGKRDPQLPQMFYPIANESFTINHGDYIAARCTMVSVFSV